MDTSSVTWFLYSWFLQVGEQGSELSVGCLTAWYDSSTCDSSRLKKRELRHQLEISWLDMISLFMMPPGWRTGGWGISWTPHGLTWFLYSWSLQVGEQGAKPSVGHLKAWHDFSTHDPSRWRTGSWAISWTSHGLTWFLYLRSLQVGEQGAEPSAGHLTAWHDFSTPNPLENRELSNHLDTPQLDIIPLLAIPPGWRAMSWAISWHLTAWHDCFTHDPSRLENWELSR
jgi:hypothetical protein